MAVITKIVFLKPHQDTKNGAIEATAFGARKSMSAVNNPELKVITGKIQQ